MLAELLEVVDGALRALDADEIDIARARLLALAETVRATCHARERTWRLSAHETPRDR
jgi:hypothetical protein